MPTMTPTEKQDEDLLSLTLMLTRGRHEKISVLLAAEMWRNAKEALDGNRPSAIAEYNRAASLLAQAVDQWRKFRPVMKEPE